MLGSEHWQNHWHAYISKQTNLLCLGFPTGCGTDLAGQGQKTKGLCREALRRCKVPISSCHHPFGTHGIRPMSARQGCPESSKHRDGAEACHTHSSPSLSPASAENGVSHSPLGFQHSLKAWSTAPNKGPEQAAGRSKQQGFPYCHLGWGHLPTSISTL